MQLLKVFTLLSVLSGAAQAALVNSDFDATALVEGGFTCGVIPGWTSYGGGCGIGVFNPTSAQYPGGNAPSNDNVAYLNGSGFWQTDSLLTWVSGQQYTFGMLIGRRFDDPYNGFILGLHATDGTTPAVASIDHTFFAIPAAGTFFLATVSYTVQPTDTFIGQPVAVSFRAGNIGVQTNFDNANLQEGAVPEPGTLGLMGAALMVAGLWHRRSRANQ